MNEVPRSTSTEPPPVLTRVKRSVDEFAVPNRAHGSLPPLRSWPKPAFWNESPRNVATNSSERPGPKAGAALGLARPPSTLIEPPATAEPPVPPLGHSVDDQSLGRFVPENSAATVGARVTSPPVVSATYVPEPVVPAPKSAADVSDSAADGLTNDAGAAGATGDVDVFPCASAEVTR